MLPKTSPIIISGFSVRSSTPLLPKIAEQISTPTAISPSEENIILYIKEIETSSEAKGISIPMIRKSIPRFPFSSRNSNGSR